ncbi:hypothetical protein VOI32_19120 [Paraburkholderia caribensis]|uniref:Cation/H+ exchanger domain-containing protein n=1 Tax=Paraburkholderia caribensis TaxID=75105 RepID=A0ABV0DY08_9BURK|nr:hypothetical protein [Paraburkholderia caribensis]MCO4876684.1 hypothetical protein [Paraburkholderia caribensis]
MFVAGVALRHEELDATGEQMPSEALADVERSHKQEAATSPELAHAYMAESMMAFAVEIERIVEFALMLLVGSVISAHWRELLDWHAIWPALFLLLVARPIGTALSLYGSAFDRQQRILTAWMGIRGVGAFYYLLFLSSTAAAPSVLSHPRFSRPSSYRCSCMVAARRRR